MSFLKPTASLTSGLLVRKGSAVPSGYNLPLHAARTNAIEEAALNDRQPPPVSGWIDSPPLAAAPPPVEAPLLAAKAAPDAAGEAPVTRAGAGERGAASERGAKVSLRLDADRHTRLRIAALHLGRSGQQLLVEALDRYLDTAVGTVLAGQCACLQPTKR
jgi:hypothetical protein